MNDTADRVVINIGDLDYNIKAILFDNMFKEVAKVHKGANVTEDEFEEALDAGLRDKVISLVKDFYAFIGDVKVNISDNEYYTMYEFMCS